jgi:2-polyprenyl-3-methyl-5-hydroxy-6-metoxy-1,4-benzoquinol methylase
MDIEIADDSFDVAVCMEAIAYMEDQGAFFEKVARILKVNGFLLLTTPNWPLWVSQDMKRGSPATLAANHLSKNSLRQLVEPHLKVLNLTTLLPKGNKGICRITNSFKLNKLLNLIIEERTLDKAKGRMGLGSSLFVLAQKR